MGDRCGDNRFEVIAKAKAKLLESTNIETSEDEMKVLDNFLFRCWQMGWLDRYDSISEEEFTEQWSKFDKKIMEGKALQQYEVPTGSIKIWDLPNGYIFKDENGNIINATKIVLEKKKKDVGLTQEQINAMVHDSCVLFCKHCGCGVPRDTCLSLGTCNDHDEYRSTIRAYLMNKCKD